MALIECKNCGHRISDKAAVCPKCGTPTKEEPKEEKVLQDNKGNEEVMYLSAVSCLEEGRLDEARDYIAGLLAINSEELRYQKLQEKLKQMFLQKQLIEEKQTKRKTISSIIIAVVLIALTGMFFVWQNKENKLTDNANEGNITYSDNLKKSDEYSFNGRVNDKYEVVIELQRNGSVLNGRFWYKSTMKKLGDVEATYIILKGDIDDDGNFKVKGTFYKSDYVEIWEGHLDDSGIHAKCKKDNGDILKMNAY